jgi:hypothetical protein
LKKIVIIIALIVLFVSIVGCIYVDPFVKAGETIVSTGQSTASQLCKINCDNHVKEENLPPGCSCPETTTPITMNVTPTSTEK